MTGHDWRATLTGFKRIILRLPDDARADLFAYINRYGLRENHSIAPAGETEDFSSDIARTVDQELDAMFARARIQDDQTNTVVVDAEDRSLSTPSVPPSVPPSPPVRVVTESPVQSEARPLPPSFTVPRLSATGSLRRQASTVVAVSLTAGQGDPMLVAPSGRVEEGNEIPPQTGDSPDDVGLGAMPVRGRGRVAVARGRIGRRGRGPHGTQVGVAEEGMVTRRSTRHQG